MVPVLLRASASTAVLLALAACSTPDGQAGLTVPAPAKAIEPAPLTPLVYRSVFEGYQSDRESEATNWKQANDTVHTIGGWRSYAREGTAAAPGATR